MGDLGGCKGDNEATIEGLRLDRELQVVEFTFLTIGLLLISSALFSPQSLAQTFDPLPESGAPSATTGGGRRDAGKCRETRTPNQPDSNRLAPDQLLTALIPRTNSGLTLAERPTFLFYVPQTSAKSAEFILEDNNLNRLATIQLQLTDAPGVYSLTPTATDLPLSLDKEYQWAFSLVCGAEGDLKDPIVTGRVRRIAPNPALVSKLATASAFERAKLYAAAGIWYEAATTLATLRQAQPQDPQLLAGWKELLRSVGLDAIAQAAIKAPAQPASKAPSKATAQPPSKAPAQAAIKAPVQPASKALTQPSDQPERSIPSLNR